MRRAERAGAVGVALAVGAFGLSGCGSTRDRDRGGPPAVVASTDVWGSVAQAVAGDDARAADALWTLLGLEPANSAADDVVTKLESSFRSRADRRTDTRG